MVHGDDFTFLCHGDQAKKIIEDMKAWYDLKVRALIGDDSEDDKKVTILNRTLRHVGAALEYNADEKHEAEIREKVWDPARVQGVGEPS